MSRILITGATGPLGKAVTENLIKRMPASDISVLVRDAGKAAHFKAQSVNVLTGDYNDYASLLNAFKGIEKLYMVSGNDLENRITQQDNVVNAAREAGVKHVVYTSFQRKNETSSSPIGFVAESHLNTEKKLKESGLIYTILEHGIYADMIPIFVGEQVLKTGTIYLPAGEGKTAYAMRTDFAEAGADVLLDNTARFNNKNIELTGSEALSWAQIAVMITEITGVHITYVAPSNEEFNAAMAKAGVPEHYIHIFTGFGNANGEGEFATVTNNLETILGRKPETVKEFLQSVYGKK